MPEIGGSAWSDSQKERNISQERIRINEQIRISPVRLIDDEGGQVGIVSIEEARDLADEKGLDLVEVAPEARRIPQSPLVSKQAARFVCLFFESALHTHKIAPVV